MAISKILFIGLLFLACCVSSPGQDLEKLLDAQFTKELATPDAYSEKVQAECRTFPEGLLFPYTFIAQSWCHQIYQTPSLATKKLPLVEAVLRLGFREAAAYLRVAKLTDVKANSQQGCYIANLAMAAASYRLAGGKQADIVTVEKHLISLLEKDLAKRPGVPLFSYPGLVWPMETSVALFALNIHDRVEQTQIAKPLVEKHYQWLVHRGMDPLTKLPCSQVLRNKQLVDARGCDLSWRLALWSELNRPVGEKWYQHYRSTFWRKGAISQGFREWGSSRINTIDMDSGPIVDGIGGTATVLGLCSTRAYGDASTTGIIEAQARMLYNARNNKDIFSKMITRTIDTSMSQIGIHLDNRYITGFLFGDCTVFYAMSWHAYPAKPL